MKIGGVVMRRLEMPMREPFVASYGTEWSKVLLVLEVHTQAGGVGYAECVAMAEPLYTEETSETAWLMLRDFFIPSLLQVEIHDVAGLRGLTNRLARFRGNPMAKAAIEMAVWDAYAAETQTPLTTLLGGGKTHIPVGISVGIQPSTERLVEKVADYLAQGFRRVKVKIKPGWDLEPLHALRAAFDSVPLWADANSAYQLEDTERLRQLDELGLMMIEQPLGHDDMVDHARLQSILHTPICLDESIRGASDARKAIQIGACRVMNLKLGRVGGFGEALRIHDLCYSAGVPLWCGGMLETGIGRLHNIAIASLPGFQLPGDTAPSDRYFGEDIIDPPVEFSTPGELAVEPLCGVAERVVPARLDKWTTARLTFRP
ncbi:MAG: o-succinylbenzoate synthase [Alicyclobacillus sp.]|nr:o-succinylbenzoate synthase [Alicyclobacillus sp.]